MKKEQTISITLQNAYESNVPNSKGVNIQKFTQAYDNQVMKDELMVPSASTKRDSVFGSEVFINPTDRTFEASPCDANYRDSLNICKSLARPTLEELHNPAEKDQLSKIEKALAGDKSKGKPGEEHVKFGWIRGVFLRCILNIWGVMLFLRMGWMTGQAGIGLSIAIVVLATVVTLIATMSMSAICTNGEVKGGGAYYMISRSLGPEVGGAIGVIYSFANAIAVALFVVGAAETVRDILRECHTGITHIPSGINDVRIAGVGFLLIITGITGIGMEFENKTQILLLVLLLTALMDYFVGACLTPRPDQIVRGFTGWQWRNARDNFGPNFRDGESFFSVFAIFFPSVIGTLAGSNISGDLKDPSKSLPKGTFLSIIVTSTSYIMIIVWLGCTLIRDASGNLNELENEEYRNCKNRQCTQGMMNFDQVMEMSSAFGPLIYVGSFAATLSSALGSLVSAPRLFQALCKDDIFPYLKIFAKGYGPSDDPRRASFLAFIISLIFICIGDLNVIAPYISNFFMATYCLINFACFNDSLANSPGFRPTYKYYNKWISLLGAICCVSVMFLMNWVTSLVTFILVIAIFFYIQKIKPPINWGSSTQGFYYKNALSAVIKLNGVDEHVKTFRPSILVLTGNTYSRPKLVDFANSLSKNIGLMICGQVIKDHISHSVRAMISEYNYMWLDERKIRSFYSHIESESLSQGVSSLIQVSGLGKLRPNMLLMGFKSDWQNVDPKEAQEYLKVIHFAFDMHLSVGIFRLRNGLDFGKYHESLQELSFNGEMKGEFQEISLQEESDKTVDYINPEEDENVLEEEEPYFRKSNGLKRLSKIPNEVIIEMDQFRKKQVKGTIDVWWLYDDGGLTMLLPYLLTTRSQWSDCTLRVFSVTHCETDLDQAQVNMAALFKKFRISISAITVISMANDAPSQESKSKFKLLISKWRVDEENSTNSYAVTKTDLTTYKQKTYRYLRLRELLDKHSQSATLIVMTLPVLRRGLPEPLYLAWLDFLTNDLPPFLFIRGNQTNVLTFYS